VIEPYSKKAYENNDWIENENSEEAAERRFDLKKLFKKKEIDPAE